MNDGRDNARLGIPARRVAIVTGGAGRSSATIVSRLKDDGFDVVVADLFATDRVLTGEHVMAVDVDVADPAAAKAMAATVLERLGRIDVLINNAGITGPSAPVGSYPVEDWHRVIVVNLFGVFHCTQACLPALRAAATGRIVNIASVVARNGSVNSSAYSASKAAVVGFTRSLAMELADSATLANCVIVGSFETRGGRVALGEEEREMLLAGVPLRRMARSTELAELVAWLASGRCTFSTGASFDLTGGQAVY